MDVRACGIWGEWDGGTETPADFEHHMADQSFKRGAYHGGKIKLFCPHIRTPVCITMI